MDNNNNNSNNSAVERKKYFNIFNSFLRSFKFNLRRNFAKSCEESFSAALLDKVYYSLLNSSIRVLAVFLVSFGASSLIFNYLNELDLFSFFTNTKNIGSVAITVIGLVLFTTKKTVGEILSGSKFFSQFSFVYSQSGVLSHKNLSQESYGNLSSSLFLGIILGILSLLFPSVNLALFILVFIYIIFVFNRPECGVLFTMFAVPFISAHSVLIFTYATFIAFIYKFLRGKRHMNFGLLSAVMISTAILFVFKGYFTASGTRDFVSTLSHIGFILICLVTVNLVRATSMLNKCINILTSVTRAYIVVFLLYYLSCIFFGISRTTDFIDSLMLSGLFSAVSELSFFTPMLSIAVPLNFAVMISSKNATGFIKNVIYFIIMLVSSFFVSRYAYTLILLLSCVLILCFIKKRFILIALPCPLLTFGIVKLYDLIPDAYSASVFSEKAVTGNEVYMSIRDNLFFGIGFGEKNLELSLAKYTDIGASSDWWITESTLISTVNKIGIVGVVLVLIIIAFMITNNLDFIIYANTAQTRKIRILAAGLLACALSFTSSCLFLDCIYDFRIALLFGAVISLGYSLKQCIEADYVDSTSVREYKTF